MGFSFSNHAAVIARLRRDSIRVSSGCMEWTKNIGNNGYGVVYKTTDGIRTRMTTHRLAWTVFRGPIPEGKFICHTCDNKKCINIDHLYVGTAADNGRDFAERGTHWSKIYPERLRRGASHTGAKLTDVTAMKIRELYAAGRGMQSLSDEFNVSLKTVMNVIHGRVWQHVGGPIVPEPPKGEPSRGNAKIDEPTVEIIRILDATKCVTREQLSKWFSLTKSSVRNICIGHTWKNVRGPFKEISPP